MKRWMVLAVACLMGSVQAHAGGFFIGEQGARAQGMGGAFTAVSDDPTAAWFNPAGVAFQEGLSGTLNADVIVTNNEFVDTFGFGGPAGRGYKAKRGNFFIPHGYIAYNRDDLPVAFGLAINAPFGLETDWSGSGAPFSSVLAPAPLRAATVTFSRIQMVNINPSVAFKVSDTFSLAIGAAYYNVMNADLNNPFFRLGGSGSGWGMNVAALYKGDRLSLGASYRSQVKTNLSGVAVYPLGNPPLLPPGFSTSGSTSITFPDMLNLGIAYQVSEALLLSADVDWVNWSTYDRLVITQPALGPAGTLVAVRNWKATVAFRIGMEWSFAENQRIRLGYVFDPTPIDALYFEPRVPGNDRQLFNIGYGYAFDEATSVDLAYSYVRISDRNETGSPVPFYNGKYSGDGHVFAASLTHHF